MQLAEKPKAVSDVPDDGTQVLSTNGVIEVRKSGLGGFGIFAVRDLAFQEHILVERTLFHAKGPTALTTFGALDEKDQERFLDLHGHDPEDDTLEARILAIFFTNK